MAVGLLRDKSGWTVAEGALARWGGLGRGKGGQGGWWERRGVVVVWCWYRQGGDGSGSGRVTRVVWDEMGTRERCAVLRNQRMLAYGWRGEAGAVSLEQPRLEFCARLEAAEDDLLHPVPDMVRAAHQLCEGGEGVELMSLVEKSLVRHRRAESDHVARGSVDEVADGVGRRV